MGLVLFNAYSLTDIQKPREDYQLKTTFATSAFAAPNLPLTLTTTCF